MPIYAYRCSTCGRAKDVLRKMSDPVLSECPFCGAATFVKQVTAAGFQLKGSGWYVTDFRGDSKPSKPADGGEAGAPEAQKSDGKAGDGKAAEGSGKSGDAPAAGAVQAPASKPDSGSSSSAASHSSPAASPAPAAGVAAGPTSK